MGLFRRGDSARRADIDRLTAELAEARFELQQATRGRTELEERLSALDALNRSLQAQVTTICDELNASVNLLDARINGVATELTNQLTELGGEIDALESPTPNGHEAPDIDQLVDDRVNVALGEAMDDITTVQERLANEQARYQIQFRKDLAEVADRARRVRTG